MEYKDYYKMMGLSRDATQDQIKHAYRKLVRKYHPDVSKEPEAEKHFKEVQEAYEVLKDPKNRNLYDQLGENWNQPQPPPHSGFNQTQSNVDPAAFEDLINSIFGGQGQARSSWQQQHAPAYDQGQDVYAKLNIDLEDSYHGREKMLQLQMGDELKTIKVKIPPGIGDKQQIRLKKQGIKRGKHAGDLYIEINLNPHPLYKLENKDIHLILPIAPWEAALGATIKTPTLGGEVNLKIDKLSQSGKKMRLKGRGLPGNPQGDQYVTLEIMIPPKQSEQADKLYEELEKAVPFNPREKLGITQ